MISHIKRYPLESIPKQFFFCIVLSKARFDRISYEQHLFSCVCCHELKWKNGVQSTEPDSEHLVGKVDVYYVTRKHRDLFLKLDLYWICKLCNSLPLPKLCAKNNLMCPWEDVPDHLLPLNPVSST